jgi:hypothetical protein
MLRQNTLSLLLIAVCFLGSPAVVLGQVSLDAAVSSKTQTLLLQQLIQLRRQGKYRQAL